MANSSTPSDPPKMQEQAQPRVLVVDDDLAILKVWLRVLGTRTSHASPGSSEKRAPGSPPPVASSEAGFSIDTASNGMEGYQKVISALAEARPYLFALVDMRMPGWDGLETLLHMLEKDPQLEVAICSAFSDISREEVAQRIGRADLQWLRKPFDLEVARELARKLSEQGARRRQGR